MEKNKTKKNGNKFIVFISTVLGIMIMALPSFINFGLNIEKVVSVGIIFILVPFAMFQYSFFSGRSGLLLKKSDLKTFWLWAFISVFLAIDTLIFSSVKIIFGITQKGWISVLSKDYFLINGKYIIMVFMIISGIALFHRFKLK